MLELRAGVEMNEKGFQRDDELRERAREERRNEHATSEFYDGRQTVGVCTCWRVASSHLLSDL